jgi:hypothetical protein
MATPLISIIRPEELFPKTARTGQERERDANPEGEVLHPGTLYEVKNIPDFHKFPDTDIEIVGIFHF